ncbi:MAG TPA: cytochrome c3 family protein [Symbiobacteriaceae bacterium]|nr:cytochrome c3 family protein [Symbiobacteriaceae bacterium]
MSAEKRSRFKRFLRFAGPATPLVLAAIALLVIFGGGSAMNYANTPEFCSSCHSMAPLYDSWEVSPHAEAEVTCIECHSDPGALGELAAHVKGIRMLYKTIAQIKPTLVMSHEIPNSSCEKCHAMEDEKAKGVKVSHQMHLSEGVSCQDCHFGLVHLANEFKPGDERFHNICLSCHEEEKVVLKATGSTSCTACHADLTEQTPANHTPDWLGQHGKSATAEQNCGQCHLADSAGPHAPISNPTIFDSDQTSDACAACHQAPMPHKEPYLLYHGTDARSMGGAVCSTCHSPSTPVSAKPPHANAAFCSNCHSNVTMPHEANWMAKHGQAAVTSDNPVCITCHSSANRVNPSADYAANDFCIKCHNGLEMPHTEKFTAEHGRLAVKSGISCMVCHSALNPVNASAPHASGSYCAACHQQSKHPAGWVAAHGPQTSQTCYICHSEEKTGNNSCQACHQGTPGEETLFHPDRYWFINHRAAAQTQGTEGCMKCHNEVQPSCSKCHTNR